MIEESKSNKPPMVNRYILLMMCFPLIFINKNDCYAATVKKVSSKKGTVTLDISPDETIEVDHQICIFNENDKKIDCGTVTKVKGKTATLKMKSKKKIKKIKPDMSARLEEESEGGTSGESSSSTNGKVPMGLHGKYIYTIATPSTFNKLGYLVPTSTTPTSLWKPEGSVSNSALGLSLSFSIPVSKFAIVPGLRYRSTASAEVLSDYVTDRRDPYVSSTVSTQNLGFFVDFQFLRTPLGGITFFNMASGLDLDSSTVTFKAFKLDDTGATPKTELATATSKLTVISLRIAAGLDLLFGKGFSFSSGLTLLAPLAGVGAQFSGELADNEQKGVQDPGADLKKSLDHKKNTFGAEFVIGPSIFF